MRCELVVRWRKPGRIRCYFAQLVIALRVVGGGDWCILLHPRTDRTQTTLCAPTTISAAITSASTVILDEGLEHLERVDVGRCRERSEHRHSLQARHVLPANFYSQRSDVSSPILCTVIAISLSFGAGKAFIKIINAHSKPFSLFYAQIHVQKKSCILVIFLVAIIKHDFVCKCDKIT